MCDWEDFLDILNVPDVLRFSPTDQEIIRRIGDSSFRAPAINEEDLRRFDPWDIPGVNVKRGREWFFFSLRDQMSIAIGQEGIYRATDSGYWKITEKDTKMQIVFKGKTLIGMKRTMVFYQGRMPTITKTNWLMHEYRLEGSNNEWVICKVTNCIRTPCPQYIMLSYPAMDGVSCFVLSNTTMDGLKTEVLSRFNEFEPYALKYIYKDEDEEMTTIACDKDLQCCLEYFKSSGRNPVKLSLVYS